MTRKRGCLALLVLLGFLAGIYFYAGREAYSPSRPEGYLPPSSQTAPPPGGTLDPARR